jgi:peptidyl-prolyl cis-trans isomerase B (cyclophilin B)
MSRLLVVAAILASLVSLPAPRLRADDDPAAQPPAAAVDVLAEWDQLRHRKQQIAARLAVLQKEFATADASRKRTIREEFGALADEYTRDVADKMTGLAAQVLAKRENDPEAAAILAKQAFQANRFARAAELAEIVERAGANAGYAFDRVRRIAAVSHFALHDFERAIELLEASEHQPNWAPDPSLEKPELLPAAKEYVELWRAEQAIRTREAALEGDARLPRAKLEIVDADGKPKGDVEVLLFEDHAPNTVASFVRTVQDGGYDGTPFHLIFPLRYVQTGRVEPRATWTIDSEAFAKDSRRFFRGSLATLAYPSTPDAAGSEFLITLLPTYQFNATTDTDGERHGGNTVFGRVVQGMDVVDAIRKSDRIAKATMLHVRPHEYEPKRNDPAATPE